MENLDCTNVVIVGGGIAGLYTAWRLATSTPYVVTVLEYSSRFGGRYHTCKMPGGFPADLGAMRYFPLTQPTLHCLIQKMDLPIEKLFMNSTGKENTAKSYLRNVHVRYDVNDLQHLYAFTDDEKKLFGAARVKDNVKESDDGDFQKARFTGTGCLAKDVCMAEYFSHYLNSGVLEGSLPNYPSSCTLAEVNGYKRQFQEEDDKRELAGYHCVKGGMERIVIALRKELSKFQNVKLLNNHPVTRVEENGKSFIVRGDNCGKDFSIPCDKIILACNARGIELITWISPFNRVTHLQTQLSKINWTNSIKLFLTYRTPWWQDHGLVTGPIFTDLPIGSVVAFGDRGTNGEYSTLLACFTYKFIDIFQGLNQDHAERFENTIGEVEEGLVPSKRLVDYVERQLIKVFGA